VNFKGDAPGTASGDAGLGWAQATQTEILKEISHDKLRSLLQGMGFDFTDNSTDKIITFRF
jgi:hypothetical protein